MDGPELSFGQVFVMVSSVIVAFIVGCEITRRRKREQKEEQSSHGKHRRTESLFGWMQASQKWVLLQFEIIGSFEVET